MKAAPHHYKKDMSNQPAPRVHAPGCPAFLAGAALWLIVLICSACAEKSPSGAEAGGAGGSGGGGATPAARGGAGGSGGGSLSGGTGGASGPVASGGRQGSDGSGGAPPADAAGPETSRADAGPQVDAAAGETPPAGAGRNILMVVGNENGTSARGEGIGDKFLRARLEAQGHKVTLAGDNGTAATLTAAAAQADLVIVSESVGSAMLQGKLKSVTTAILNYEAFIQDEMGLTPPGPPGDPGLPDTFALGVKANETRIDIVMPAHPLAAGLTGTVAVYRMPRSITWGKVAATAEVVATLPGDPAGVATYVYRKGARLQDGTMAAGLRVGIFLEDDDTTGTANLLTAEGLQLIDAAVKFALQPAP